MKKRYIYFSILVALLFACKGEPKKEVSNSDILSTGTWRGVLSPQGKEIPFLFDVTKKMDQYELVLRNADERIPLSETLIEDDSIHIPMYIFDATIKAKIEKGIMTGVWVKNYAEDYIVPFKAFFGVEDRFLSQQSSSTSFDGKWEVDFIDEDGVDKAIGIFKQNGNKVTGTFLTPTGDYRFLEGIVEGESMKLSCFDGTHAYLFNADVGEDGEIEGEFWSGKTWYQKWTAKRNDEFELPDPYSMTYIKEGYDKFEFKFPNTEGNLVSLSDDNFRDKVVVVQILGTWCPNCMDETKFFSSWYERNKSRGVEIVGLSFERKVDPEYAMARINKMKEKLGVDYEVLFAGTTSTESKEAALPMLNKIMSFPTSIILDKQHNVRKIHTGFSGPGTGIYYENYVEEFNLFMDKLLAEY